MDTVVQEMEARRVVLAQRRAEYRRRRHIGLVIGASLAFIFGGPTGLVLACAIVLLARTVEVIYSPGGLGG